MSRRILVVSDNATTRTLISTKLRSEKYEIVESHTPEDAVEHVKDCVRPPDLAIISLDMFEPDTCWLIMCLREFPCNRFMPILTIAGAGMQDKQLEWLNAGATCWLERPFSGGELQSLVDMLLF